MRALGLPNTKHFHEITRIEDALARESYLRRATTFILLES
jgi:splicing factor 3A subunit 3